MQNLCPIHSQDYTKVSGKNRFKLSCHASYVPPYLCHIAAGRETSQRKDEVLTLNCKQAIRDSDGLLTHLKDNKQLSFCLHLWLWADYLGVVVVWVTSTKELTDFCIYKNILTFQTFFPHKVMEKLRLLTTTKSLRDYFIEHLRPSRASCMWVLAKTVATKKMLVMSSINCNISKRQ